MAWVSSPHPFIPGFSLYWMGKKNKYAPRHLPHGSLYPIPIRTLLPIEGWKMGSSDIGLWRTIRWSLPLGPSVNTHLIFSPWYIWLVPLGNLSPCAPWDWSNLESLGVSVIQLQIKWKGIFGSSFKTIPPPWFFFGDKPFSWEILFICFTVKLRALVKIKVACVWRGAHKDMPLPERPPFQNKAPEKKFLTSLKFYHISTNYVNKIMSWNDFCNSHFTDSCSAMHLLKTGFQAHDN